jgi:beta-phosphoglucomutase-like phosphatase (HAD superfamily)
MTQDTPADPATAPDKSPDTNPETAPETAQDTAPDATRDDAAERAADVPLKAILFGAIGSVTETSEIQREAYNRAFHDAGLDWEWDAYDYLEMLEEPGGRERIARFAEARGEEVDVTALHDAKVAHFEDLVMEKEILPRPGVRELIDWAQAEGIKLGFATTTSPGTVSLILGGLAPEVLRSDFDFIGNRSHVETPKPAPDIYEYALESLGVIPDAAIAIEDTPESARAARAAGLRVLGFPGAAAAHRDFPEGVEVVHQLTQDLFVPEEA